MPPNDDATTGIQLALCLCSLTIYRANQWEVKKQRRGYLFISFVLLVLQILASFPPSISLSRTLITVDPANRVLGNYFDTPSEAKDWIGEVCRLVVNFVGDGVLVSGIVI